MSIPTRGQRADGAIAQPGLAGEDRVELVDVVRVARDQGTLDEMSPASGRLNSVADPVSDQEQGARPDEEREDEEAPRQVILRQVASDPEPPGGQQGGA